MSTPSRFPDRHRWGLNLWVSDAEEARLRVYFARSPESLAEAARRLLLAEADKDRSNHNRNADEEEAPQATKL